MHRTRPGACVIAPRAALCGGRHRRHPLTRDTGLAVGCGAGRHTLAAPLSAQPPALTHVVAAGRHMRRQRAAPARHARTTDLFTWIDSGTLEVSWALKVDTLTAVMLVVITPCQSCPRTDCALISGLGIGRSEGQAPPAGSRRSKTSKLRCLEPEQSLASRRKQGRRKHWCHILLPWRANMTVPMSTRPGAGRHKAEGGTPTRRR